MLTLDLSQSQWVLQQVILTIKQMEQGLINKQMGQVLVIRQMGPALVSRRAQDGRRGC